MQKYTVKKSRQDNYRRKADDHYETTDFMNAGKDAIGKKQQIAIWVY